MSMHIAEIWARCEQLTRDIARDHPGGCVTFVRDVQGRCSFALEGFELDHFRAIEEKITADKDLKPFLGALGVQALDQENRLQPLIHKLRRRLDCPGQAFLVDRLLSNESWSRASDKNPPTWPPVVAFYSFKGGVGRTTAAGLTGLALAREGKRVIIIDLDLEAPGIEGFFFTEGAEGAGGITAGVVDYLLEQAILGAGYQPDMNDFVLPYSDPVIASVGGSLVIAPAGRVDESYPDRLGRLNLAEIARTTETGNPIRGFINALLGWRTADIVIVDCRTGFTDLGGMTLNGLSLLDVLVFRAGEVDRRYLPIVLDHITRFREGSAAEPLRATELARSFLLVFTMTELPARSDEAVQYVKELREFASEVCWDHVFKRFADHGFAYPSTMAIDTPHEPVPHDVVLIPYLRDFAMSAAVADMLRIQGERPDRPYDALVRRLLDVKLPQPTSERPVAHGQVGEGQQILESIKTLTESPAGEQEFTTTEDFRARFLPRAAYRTLLDPKAFLVLGRKGAGKSVLFQLLQHSEYLSKIAHHLGLDAALVADTRWEVGFSTGPEFPAPEDFQRAERSVKDPDSLTNLWRALLVQRLSRLLRQPLPALATFNDCVKTLKDDQVQEQIRNWLDNVDRELEATGRFCCLSYDDLDTNVARDDQRRARLLSALIAFWQGAPRRWSRIRGKIFLRDDLWNREVDVTDKAKVREGIDRATITWDGVDIYRTILKRLGNAPQVRRFFTAAGLWSPVYEEMLQGPVGFVPPEDERWVKSAIEALTGETMGAGETGHKKGYVYSWVLTHAADAAAVLRPRNALLLFSEAAKLQKTVTANTPILRPQSFMNALRGDVSRLAVADLKAEFRLEWPAGKAWLPEKLKDFERVWPVAEGGLASHLQKSWKFERGAAQKLIQRMVDAGLMERRASRKDGKTSLQIPDIYLFGLGLTRRG